MMMTNTNGAGPNEMSLGLADGLNPVPWPGQDYEFIASNPGFVSPQKALESLNVKNMASAWTADIPERATVEEIYTLERSSSPLEIRARLAGSGAHPDADFIEYVLEFKFLNGTQHDGRYGSKEVTRGTLEQMTEVVSKLDPMIDAQGFSFCMHKSDYPIVDNLDVVDGLIARVKN